ncbi:MAG: RidA family protein [Acidimicrobiia bacterium]
MSARSNPPGLHDPTPFGYSHTVTVPAGAAMVVVAGQYGSAADGGVISPHFHEQVGRAFENVATALRAHGLDLGHVVQLRSYVVDHDVDKLGVVVAAVRGIWGDTAPANTVLGVARLATPDIAFEVEAIAVSP